MTEMSTTSILMVDDEPNVLDGYRRALRGRFTVVTANSGEEGLAAVRQALEAGTPFPVVVSDMMMPTMNGAQFLSQVHAIDPAAVEMLLSGQADLESTISAVNNGNLFRFLTKPCAAPDLQKALDAAAEQHRLARAERELLESTLAGAVDVLTEVLSMASPEAFSRTERIRTLVDRAGGLLTIEDWRLPLATMLSQIGCIAVPADVLHRAGAGGELDAGELEVYLAHPQMAERLLARIPRLEEVARWVGNQPVRPPGLDRSGGAWHPAAPHCEPSEAVLRAGIAYLGILDATFDPARAMTQLGGSGHYSKEVLSAIKLASSDLAPKGVLRELAVDQIRPGMKLEEDVETVTGMILVRKGERVTEAVATRLANFSRTVGVKEPIKVLDGG
jgi:CheY-like chemotaxis protein